MPHPLDFDWRFTHLAEERLLDLCLRLSTSGDLVALFGAPSLLRAAIERGLPRRVVLLDRTDVLSQMWPQVELDGLILRCDLLRDKVPDIAATVVVTDPPWYEEYTRAFLWTATRVCQMSGHVLLCVPQGGTRPGMEREWKRTLAWAKELGLGMVGYEKATVSYASPLFERNALRAEGMLGVPFDWRRADLAIFSRIHDTAAIRPEPVSTGGDWIESQFTGSRIRVRRVVGRQPLDPRLVSIVDNDILPSVSRRDPRRSSPDVWTSGNRVFACHSPEILVQVLKALETGGSPIGAVASRLSRHPTDEEAELVSKAVRQIVDLTALEHREYLEWKNDH